MNRREARRQATSRAILTAARRLFLQQGLAQTSMDQVAQAADVSRATLFNYYPGKAALLAALGESLELRMVAALGHCREKQPDADAALRQLFAHAGRVLEQTADLTRLLLLGDASQEGFPRLQAAFTELARDGQAQERWRTDLPAASVGEHLYLAFIAGLLGWGESAATAGPAALFKRRAEDLLKLLAVR